MTLRYVNMRLLQTDLMTFDIIILTYVPYQCQFVNVKIEWFSLYFKSYSGDHDLTYFIFITVLRMYAIYFTALTYAFMSLTLLFMLKISF